MTSSAPPTHTSDNPIKTSAEDWVDRLLLLLRSTMQTQGVSQLSVQESLGWGRTYISQLLRKQKALRFDQVLMILQTLEIEPKDFFAELFGIPAQTGPKHLTAKERQYLNQSLANALQTQQRGDENVTLKQFSTTIRSVILHAATLGAAPLDHFVEIYRRELQLDGLLREDAPDDEVKDGTLKPKVS